MAIALEATALKSSPCSTHHCTRSNCAQSTTARTTLLHSTAPFIRLKNLTYPVSHDCARGNCAQIATALEATEFKSPLHLNRLRLNRHRHRTRFTTARTTLQHSAAHFIRLKSLTYPVSHHCAQSNCARIATAIEETPFRSPIEAIVLESPLRSNYLPRSR